MTWGKRKNKLLDNHFPMLSLLFPTILRLTGPERRLNHRAPLPTIQNSSFHDIPLGLHLDNLAVGVRLVAVVEQSKDPIRSANLACDQNNRLPPCDHREFDRLDVDAGARPLRSCVVLMAVSRHHCIRRLYWTHTSIDTCTFQLWHRSRTVNASLFLARARAPDVLIHTANPVADSCCAPRPATRSTIHKRKNANASRSWYAIHRIQDLDSDGGGLSTRVGGYAGWYAGLFLPLLAARLHQASLWALVMASSPYLFLVFGFAEKDQEIPVPVRVPRRDVKPTYHYLLLPGLGLDPTSFSGTTWLVLAVACPSIPPTLLWYPSVARLLHQCDATLPHLQTPLLHCCQPALQAAAAPPPPPSCPTRQHDGAVDVVFGTPRRCPRRHPRFSTLEARACSILVRYYYTATSHPSAEQTSALSSLALAAFLLLACSLLVFALLPCIMRETQSTYLHLLCAACVQVAGTTAAARLTVNNRYTLRGTAATRRQASHYFCCLPIPMCGVEVGIMLLAAMESAAVVVQLSA
ncbi:uncharacterized protein BKA78DRAFT_366864 [Phyllosticta capitalensis]|uniref:uncharacterized protein n=1 Tax=Phyllosticta capitalensis TaxID=121624 RepID=UPI00312F765E